MKKRRVLALFLALSMALSSNGFTALAAEQDSAVAIEAGLSEETDETKEENVVSDTNDENESNASESEDGEQDNSSENGNTLEGEGVVSEGEDASESNGETGDDKSGANGGNEDGTSDGSEETGDNESEGNREAEDNTSVEDGENGDDAEIVNGGDAIVDGNEEALAEELDSVEVYEPLMRTFTDETGMVITYDARESVLYNYEVKDGVLIRVTRNDGQEISGNVELKQADQLYHTIGENIFGDDVKNKIEYVILPSGAGITNIADSAFEGYQNLRGITLPTDLKQIGKNAFKGCTNMTQLSIPKAVESIGDSAFSGDTSLFMVYIRDYVYSNMKSIGNSAFYNCQRLEKFGSDADFVLPGYLETIGDSAFENCRVIRNITLPDTVAKLGDGAFKDCRGLIELSLSGVADIQKHAFEGCSSLLSVKFSDGNTKIDEYAFADCYGLAELKLVDTITNIGNYAFSGCQNLRYVEFENSNVVIGSVKAFPNDNEFPLWMRGKENSNVHEYAKDHNNMRFIVNNEITDEYFKYSYKCLGYTDNVSLTFRCADNTDPNENNKKKGVKAGVEISVSIARPAKVLYVEGSLKCNGTAIKKNKEGDYSFKMPVGGAYVTAEFKRDIDSEIIGNANNLTYQLSNGDALKVGQTTRMFIIDKGNDNSIVDFSRIEFQTSDSKVATVSKDGTIKAVKKGTAYITAIITLDKDKKTSQGVTIQVADAEVDSLKLKPMSYDTSIMKKVENDLKEITGFDIKKASVEKNETTFVLMATAYDKYEDNIAVDLKWSTSDSKVAKLAKTSTNSSESRNTITIPKGASGAATITATATIGSGSNQIKKSSKFTVCVQDMAPRLSASIITLNPYQTDGAALDIISAYGVEIVKNTIQLRRNEDNALISQYFKLVEDKQDNGNSSIVRFRLESLSPDIKDGTYKEVVYVEVGDNKEYLPLTVNVKRSIPNPTVTFDNKKEKVNLFYTDGKVGVEPVIGNLGNVEIEKFELKNLSTGTQDSKFDQNFEISEETDTSCVIKRSSNDMQYMDEAKKKPVVTGYLVLTFKGYKEGVNTKEYKITVPTSNIKPSYKLESTSNTFSSISGEQTVAISLIDKKTNKAVDLNEGVWKIWKDTSSKSTAVSPNAVGVDENGKISMKVSPKGTSGKVVLSISNEEWTENLKYTYNVKISNSKPTFKLSKSSVTLNKYFEDSEAKFTITPNQYGITISQLSDDDFIRPANLSSDKEAQYDKIQFDCDGDSNEVTVKLKSADIKDGSYKFTCSPIGGTGGKVTITVKVTGVLPSVSLKGSASLNLAADDADTAELTINIKNLPDGGSLDDDDTIDKITCVTNNDATDYFNFKIENTIENKKEVKKLKININDHTKVTAQTYTFNMTPSYVGYDISDKTPKTVKFKVKVYSKAITVSLKAKGKINLLQRFDEGDLVGAYNADTTAVSYNAAESILSVDNTAVPDFVENADDANNGGTTTPGGGTSGNEGGSESGTGVPEQPENGKKVTFELNGNHFEVKKDFGDANVIVDKDNDITTTDGYKFCIEKENGYDAKVEVYTVAEDKSTQTLIEGITPTPDLENNNKETYIIAAEKITGDITIVVTDVYTITLDDKTTGAIYDVFYKTGSAADYTEYKSDDKIKTVYGESLSFKYTKAGETSIVVVLDENGNKLPESSESSGNSKVYTIDSDKINGNKTITIASAYEIAEAIDKDADVDMASITYTDNSKVLTDGSRALIVYGQDLEFTVAAKAGYAVKEVNYAIGTNPTDADYRPLKASAEGNMYTIAKNAIIGNVTIKVTVKAEDEDNYIVKFSITGASVTKISEDGTQLKNPESVVIPKSGGPRSFTFTVETTENNKLRYVGTNPDLETTSTEISKTENGYTFTLPDNPRAVTTIYVKADAPKTNLKVQFKAYVDGAETTSYLDKLVSTVTFTKDDKSQIARKPILATGYANETYSEDGEVSFTIESAASLPSDYTLSIKSGGVPVPFEERSVTEGSETTAKKVKIYTLPLKDVTNDVTVDISITLNSQGGDEDEEPQSKYNLKNCIVYTPVVSNLKDTIVDARIYDVINDAEPAYVDSTSQFFNIEVIDGLLYVTPKRDAAGDLDEWEYLKNNTTYTVKIWLEFENYKSGITEDGDGKWVDKPINIKTAQILPKVVTDTNTLNLYQSNPNYTATFYVSLKDAKNSIGEIESIDFDEKDETAIDSFNWEVREVQKDGSLKVTISLNGSSLYASNSTNKIKMYVKFKDQARNTAGTAITMNIKINK